MLGIFSKKQTCAQGTLAADLRAARKSGLRTAIVVTLLVSGVVPALCLYWQSDDNQLSWVDHIRTMCAVTLHTYPLTLAVAIITISRRQKWFRLRVGSWCFAGSVILFCATLSNFVSQWTGVGFIAPAQIMQEYRNSLWGVLAVVVNALGGFYRAYGFRTFVASLLIGTYAGVTANRFLSHVTKTKPEVAELAQELIRSSNRAA